MRKLNQGWGLDRVKHRPAGSAACSSVVFEKQPLREERLLSVRPVCAAAQAPKPFGLNQRELFPDKVGGCLDFRRSVPSQPPWFRPNSIQEKLRQSARFPTLNRIYFLQAAPDRKEKLGLPHSPGQSLAAGAKNTNSRGCVRPGLRERSLQLPAFVKGRNSGLVDACRVRPVPWRSPKLYAAAPALFAGLFRYPRQCRRYCSPHTSGN